MCVSARNHQRQHRKLDLPIVFLPFLEQNGMDMSFEVIHRDQGLVERKSQRLGIGDSDQQSSGQARSLRDGQRVNRLIALSGIGQRFAHYRHNRLQVLP